eukprot:COSAG05_NODE_1903_length_3854_cov_12.540613_1_plen_58_part_00
MRAWPIISARTRIARGGPEAEPETTDPPHAFGERAVRDVVAERAVFFAVVAVAHPRV